MNINMLDADDASEIITLFLPRFLESTHHIRTFGSASCIQDCDPKVNIQNIINKKVINVYGPITLIIINI